MTVRTGRRKQCASKDVPAVQKPALAITKVATESSFNAVGQVLHYTIVATNTGNVSQAITVSDTPVLDGFVCAPANGSTVAPGGSLSCSGTHTVTQADLDAGDFADMACANSPDATEACTSKDVPAVQTRTLAIAKNTATVSFDHVGQVLTYSIVATNTGNVSQAITVDDTPVLDGFVCTPANGSTVAPGGSLSCSGTHTVTQAALDAGHFADTACANAPDATEVCASKDVPAV